MPENRTLILNHLQIEQKINRIARQIHEQCYEEKEIIIVGIADRGMHFAGMIAEVLKEITPLQIQLAELKMDKKNPIQTAPTLNIGEKEMDNKIVILIDDVLNTGLTLIYAVKHLLNSPLKQLITVALVDRKHRLFPVKADFVGLTLATTMQEHISVKIGNKKNAVYLE